MRRIMYLGACNKLQEKFFSELRGLDKFRVVFAGDSKEASQRYIENTDVSDIAIGTCLECDYDEIADFLSVVSSNASFRGNFILVSQSKKLEKALIREEVSFLNNIDFRRIISREQKG